MSTEHGWPDPHPEIAPPRFNDIPQPHKNGCVLIVEEITSILCANITKWGAFQVMLVVKNLPANAEDIRDTGSIPGLGTFLGGGRGNPPQYSSLENPTDRAAWWATVHRVTKSWTRPKQLSMYTCMHITKWIWNYSWYFSVSRKVELIRRLSYIKADCFVLHSCSPQGCSFKWARPKNLSKGDFLSARIHCSFLVTKSSGGRKDVRG